tara:strand:+ start:3012 stop:3152 length:141 start_codon:yes stop_codon:yes gene_type:complete
MQEEEFLRSVRTTGTSLGINIPNEIIKLLKIKKGDLLRIKVKKIKE